MRELHFFKYHGAGNDFILIDERSYQYNLSEKDISLLCNRHLGIGGDGLISIRPHSSLDFEMVYFNSDGVEGSMCGNGGRTATAFVHKLSGKLQFRFAAADGLHESWVLENSAPNHVMVKLGLQPVREYSIISERECFLDTGSPHHVQFVDDLEELDVISNGRAIRFDSRYAPQGVNANFVRYNDGGIFCRTYERGVEYETLSCGTGVTAAALAANLIFGMSSPVPVETRGGYLMVSFEKSNTGFNNIYLTGPAEWVFEGTFNL